MSLQSMALNPVIKNLVGRGLGRNAGNIRRLRRSAMLSEAAFAGMSWLVSVPTRLGEVGGIKCEFLTPRNHEKGTLLYLHGGGFCLNTPGLHRGLVSRMSKMLEMRGVMVDYRLAPEHPFPAGQDDCLAAYRGLLADGVKARDIVIAGDSAGGNLTLTLLLRIKAEGLPMPRCAVALSPATDMTMSAPSGFENRDSDVMLDFDSAMFFRHYYLGEGGAQNSHNPLASPLFGDFSGCCPVLLQASTSELLRDDSTRMAETLQAQGVAAECQLWRDMPHVFQAFHAMPEAGEALRKVVRFVEATPAR